MGIIKMKQKPSTGIPKHILMKRALRYQNMCYSLHKGNRIKSLSKKTNYKNSDTSYYEYMIFDLISVDTKH